MASRTTYILGFLTVVLLATGIVYVQFTNQLKIRVDEDKSTFYVKDDRFWRVSGREHNLLFDGTSRMNRDLSSIKITTLVDDSTNKTTIERSTRFRRGPVIVDTYLFDGTLADIDQFPVSHTVEIYNGSGFFYRYEVRDLLYDGEQMALNTVSMEFGRNMKVEWQSPYRWARVFKSGILKVQYDIPSDYEKYQVRLFDPVEVLEIYLDGLAADRHYEYSANATINYTSDNASVSVCLIVDGINVSCGAGGNLTYYHINLLRQRNFSTGFRAVNLTSTGNVSFTLDDRVDTTSATVNLTGFDSSGYPQDITISVEGNSTAVFPGILVGSVLNQTNFIVNGLEKSAQNFSFAGAGVNTFTINYSLSGIFKNLTFQINGFDLEEANLLDYEDTFNSTSSVNATLSEGEAPLGYFDDFENNVSGRWDYTTTVLSETELSYSTGNDDDYLRHQVSSSAACEHSVSSYADYADEAADLRNTSYASFNTTYLISKAGCTAGGGSCSTGTVGISLVATDSTSEVVLWEDSIQLGGQGGAGQTTETINFTLKRRNDDYDSWEVFKGGSSQGTKDLSSLDFTNQIKLRYKNSISYGACGGGDKSRSTTSRWDLYDLRWGGAWLQRNTTDGTYISQSNITSLVINVTSTDVTQAVLSKTDYIPENTGIQYFLTNVCNQTNPTFEEVTPGLFHVFSTTGKNLCWRAHLNSTVNTTSPIVRQVFVDVTSAIALKTEIDAGDDGTIDFTYSDPLNTSNSPRNVSIDASVLENYVSDNSITTPSFALPVSILTNSSASIQVDTLQGKKEINPVDLDSNSEISDCINLTLNCSIEAEFTNGILQFDDLRVDFLGSWNLSVVAQSNSVTKIRELLVKYSKFNISEQVSSFNFAPQSVSAKNVTPFGQSTTKPFWNITSLAYDQPINWSIRVNSSLNSCLDLRIADVANQTSFVTINATSKQFFGNKSENEFQEAWFYLDLSSCNASAVRFFNPTFCMQAICHDCVHTIDKGGVC